MKSNSLTAIILMGSLSFSFFGCLEIKVRTTVSADGSSERVIRLKQESDTLPNAAFPIPTDTSWTREWKLISDEKPVKHEYNALKRFATPEQLEQEYAGIPDTAVLGVSVHLRRSFQWFYTYFEYQETYALRNPFNRIPITNVLGKEEIDHYLYHYSKSSQDSIIETKVHEWFERNKFEYSFQGFVRAAEQRKDSALPAALFTRNKERIYTLLSGATSAMEEDSIKEKEAARDLTSWVLRIFEEGLKTNVIYNMRHEVTLLLADRDEKEHRLNTANGSYENSIQLPGLLLETNSDKVEGSLVTWKIDSDRLKVGH